MDRKIQNLFTPQPRSRGNVPLTEQGLRLDFNRKMQRIYGHRNASRRNTSHTARNAPLVQHLKYMPGGPGAKLAAKLAAESFTQHAAKQKKSKSSSNRKTKSAGNRKTKSAGNRKSKKKK